MCADGVDADGDSGDAGDGGHTGDSVGGTGGADGADGENDGDGIRNSRTTFAEHFYRT